jgi:LuxR family maltose regulon positive regulatory protein
MAVASRTRITLPFSLGTRDRLAARIRAPALDAPEPLADVRTLLESTRVELSRLSVAQAHLSSLLGIQEDDALPGGAASAALPSVESEGPEGVALEFRLFRFFEVGRGKQTAPRWASKKARLLLAYLAMKGEAPTPRDTLIDTFWPDSPPERGANNLSIAIHQIRVRLSQLVPDEDRGIRVEQGTYRLSPNAPASIDVVDFERHTTRARRDISAGNDVSARDELAAAVAICTGDLLESDPYEEWTIEPRRSYARTYLWALGWLAADAASSGDWGAVLQHGRAIVWRDACNEEGHRQIIQAYGELGDRSEALRQYRECAKTLDSQVGVAPSPETRALAARVVGKLDE